MITTGGDGGGDSSDAGGVIGGGGGGYERGGDNGGEKNTVPDGLEAFLEPYDAIVREFNSRAASNWARAASEVSLLLGKICPRALGKANNAEARAACVSCAT